MMISQSVQASPEVLRQYMAERVPLDKRIEGVYIPTILTDNVCSLLAYVRSYFHQNKIRAVGNILKRTKNIASCYRMQNLTAMRHDIFYKVGECSTAFYEEFIAKHLIVDQCTYTEELWKQRPQLPGKLTSVLGAVYFTKMVLEHIIQYERDWTNEIQHYLGDDVRYVAHDNKTCVDFLKCINDILDVYKVPEHLDSHNIQLSYQIFRNKVGLIDVTSVLEDKTNEQ